MPKSHTHARGTRFHRNRAPGVLLAAALMCAAPLAVQAEPEPAPRPTAKSPSTPEQPYEQLAFFLGNWIDAEAPPERQAYPERCNWMEGGRRHVVCRTRSRTKTGEWRESLSMFSYRATDKRARPASGRGSRSRASRTEASASGGRKPAETSRSRPARRRTTSQRRRSSRARRPHGRGALGHADPASRRRREHHARAADGSMAAAQAARQAGWARGVRAARLHARHRGRVQAPSHSGRPAAVRRLGAPSATGQTPASLRSLSATGAAQLPR
jgi:hypothetical protein